MVHSKNRNSRPSAVDPVICSDVPYGSGVCVHVLACWVHFLCMCGYAREHVCVHEHAVSVRMRSCWVHFLCVGTSVSVYVHAHECMLGAFLVYVWVCE